MPPLGDGLKRSYDFPIDGEEYAAGLCRLESFLRIVEEFIGLFAQAVSFFTVIVLKIVGLALPVARFLA